MRRGEDWADGGGDPGSWVEKDPWGKDWAYGTLGAEQGNHNDVELVRLCNTLFLSDPMKLSDFIKLLQDYS